MIKIEDVLNMIVLNNRSSLIQYAEEWVAELMPDDEFLEYVREFNALIILVNETRAEVKEIPVLDFEELVLKRAKLEEEQERKLEEARQRLDAKCK